jgi:hypothetical protein
VGLQTKGIFAFPICVEKFQGRYSKDLHKFIYANNTVFLPPEHRFRNFHKNQFDGKVENRGPPMIMGPTNWIKKYKDAELKSWKDFFYGGDSIEEPEQVVIKMPEEIKRKSIFYDLPYWKDLLIYHLLDPMHILKKFPYSIF